MTVRIFNNKVFLLFNSKVLMCLSTSQDNIEKVIELRKTILEKAKTLKKPVSELKLGEI
jgi:hypothetical protein